jgi:hypothetical protein
MARDGKKHVMQGSPAGSQEVHCGLVEHKIRLNDFVKSHLRYNLPQEKPLNERADKKGTVIKPCLALVYGCHGFSEHIRQYGYYADPPVSG